MLATNAHSTNRLAGQIVVVQMKVGTATGTFYYTYTDHLGNVTAPSWTGGTCVPNPKARYDPFGAFTTTPTGSNPTISNHGFTGHRHNNTGANDLDLIYMNARYYMPLVGRFISPDTIVPDPGNPQSYNRYVYTNNNPVIFTDASGHCAGSYEVSSGQATEDQACWDYLYNEFCGGGSVAICANWTERLHYFLSCFNSSCSVDFGSGYWTRGELGVLRDALAAAMTALNDAGLEGVSILKGIGYRRIHSGNDSYTFPGNTVNTPLQNVTKHIDLSRKD